MKKQNVVEERGPWLDGKLAEGMKHRVTLLVLDGREEQELVMVARKLEKKFASPKWKGGWMLANQLHFVVMSSGDEHRLEAHTDGRLTEEEFGLLRGYALASLEQLKEFFE